MIIRPFKRITYIVRYPRFSDETMRISILYINICVLFRGKFIINPLGLKIFILINSFIFKLSTM